MDRHVPRSVVRLSEVMAEMGVRYAHDIGLGDILNTVSEEQADRILGVTTELANIEHQHKEGMAALTAVLVGIRGDNNDQEG